jgi:DegV family protein with EDD domain
MPGTPSKEKLPSPIAIVTDSVAQIPPDMAGQLGIVVVPAILIIDGEQYLDGIDISADELYRRMRQEKILPKTAAPSVGQYYDAFASCIQREQNQIVYIGLSSRLSGIFSAATSAAYLIHQDFQEVHLHLFDSRIATMAEGFIAIETARMVQESSSIEMVLQRAENMRRCSGLVVALDTLEYLALGGRIGRAAYMLGDLANVKPIVSISEDGTVAPVARAYGSRRAINLIVERVAKAVQGASFIRLAILHADASDRGHELERLVLQRMQPDELIWSIFTPVMGAHTGPGVFGLAYSFDE